MFGISVCKNNLLKRLISYFLSWHFIFTSLHGIEPLTFVDVDQVGVPGNCIFRVVAFNVQEQELTDVTYVKYGADIDVHAITLKGVPPFFLWDNGNIHFRGEEYDPTKISTNFLFRTKGSFSWDGTPSSSLSGQLSDIIVRGADQQLTTHFLGTFQINGRTRGLRVNWIESHVSREKIELDRLGGKGIRGAEKDSKLEKGRIGELVTGITMAALGYYQLPSQRGDTSNQGTGFDGVWSNADETQLIITESKFHNGKKAQSFWKRHFCNNENFVTKIGALTKGRAATKNIVLDFLRRGEGGGLLGSVHALQDNGSSDWLASPIPQRIIDCILADPEISGSNPSSSTSSRPQSQGSSSGSVPEREMQIVGWIPGKNPFVGIMASNHRIEGIVPLSPAGLIGRQDGLFTHLLLSLDPREEPANFVEDDAVEELVRFLDSRPHAREEIERYSPELGKELQMGVALITQGAPWKGLERLEIKRENSRIPEAISGILRLVPRLSPNLSSLKVEGTSNSGIMFELLAYKSITHLHLDGIVALDDSPGYPSILNKVAEAFPNLPSLSSFGIWF